MIFLITILFCLMIYCVYSFTKKEIVIDNLYSCNENYVKKSIKFTFIFIAVNGNDDEITVTLDEIYHVQKGKTKDEIIKYILKHRKFYSKRVRHFMLHMYVKENRIVKLKNINVIVEDI